MKEVGSSSQSSRNHDFSFSFELEFKKKSILRHPKRKPDLASSADVKQETVDKED